MIENPDKFLISVLAKIKDEYTECLEVSKKNPLAEYKEISQDYEECIKNLENILSTVHSIDDLAEQDEETIGFVFECLEDFTSNFIISPDGTKNFETDMHNYAKLEELLGMFFDDEVEDSDS